MDENALKALLEFKQHLANISSSVTLETRTATDKETRTARPRRATRDGAAKDTSRGKSASPDRKYTGMAVDVLSSPRDAEALMSASTQQDDEMVLVDDLMLVSPIPLLKVPVVEQSQRKRRITATYGSKRTRPATHQQLLQPPSAMDFSVSPVQHHYDSHSDAESYTATDDGPLAVSTPLKVADRSFRAAKPVTPPMAAKNSRKIKHASQHPKGKPVRRNTNEIMVEGLRDIKPAVEARVTKASVPMETSRQWRKRPHKVLKLIPDEKLLNCTLVCHSLNGIVTARLSLSRRLTLRSDRLETFVR